MTDETKPRRSLLSRAAGRLLRVPGWLADLGLALNRRYYGQLFSRVYNSGGLHPSWYDHRIDLYYHWPSNLFWLERGVLPRRYLTHGCAVLDLFCGDGYFSRHFHSSIAGRIDAVDKDPAAIDHARRWHSAPNIAYHALDLTSQDPPAPPYDVVLWFEGIEHLSREQYRQVIGRIKPALGPGGVLFGSTGLAAAGSAMSHWEHQNEFHSTEELASFLAADFRGVEVFVTAYPLQSGGERRTAYFVLREPI